MSMGKAWLALLATMLLATSGAAQQALPPIADGAESDVVQLGTDQADRMTVPVSIGDAGPYPFIVDTGAERTVIARDLAERLALDPGRTAVMHSMTGVSSVKTVVIPSLTVSDNEVRDINAPALARAYLGAAGMLGVDSLKSQRVMLDFEAGTMTVTPSETRHEHWDGETIVVTARRKAGQLILADATADGERVRIVIDTGSQVTVGNSALRRRLFGRNPKTPLRPIVITSVTGQSITADYSSIKEIQIGGVVVRDLPVAFADVHPFNKLGLSKKPALLLGMDALRLFDRVSVDFASKKVRFLMPDGAGRDDGTRLAMRDR